MSCRASLSLIFDAVARYVIVLVILLGELGDQLKFATTV